MTPATPVWAPTSLGDGSVTALAAGHALTLAAVDDGAVSGLYRSPDGIAWTPTGDGLPPGALLAAVYVRGVDALVGTYGEGLFASDGERAWTRTGVGLPADATVFSLVDADDALWAGTRAHGVFRSGDAGRSFSATSAGLPWGGHGLEVLALVETPAGVVVSHALGLHRSADDGRTWEPVPLGTHRGPCRGLVAGPGGTLVAGLDAGIARSSDGGHTWATALEPVRGVPLASSGEVLYALVNDRLARSVDGGVSWAPFDDGITPGVCPERIAFARRALLVGTLEHGLWARAPEPALAPAPRRTRPALDGGDPNPFHDHTTVGFRLPRAARVVLAVDDAAGGEVVRLGEGVRLAGTHHVPLSADALPVGLYRARLDVEGQRLTRQLLRL